MNVFVVIVLFSTITMVIGQDDSAWLEPLSGSESLVQQSYGPAPIDTPPYSDLTVVTIPKTATAAATAFSAAVVQSPATGPIQFPEKAAAVQTFETKPRMPYSFEYEVNDEAGGLDFGHKESSDGAVVTGTYYVLLPDGRMETVNYKADDNGYVAEVSYEGEAMYDTIQTQKADGIPSGISGQLQASFDSDGLSSPLPSSHLSQPSSFPGGVPVPKEPTPQATAPVKDYVPEVSTPVWPAVKAPAVPIAPIVEPTPSVVPATVVVNAPAPVPVYDPAPASVLASGRASSSATAFQSSQGPAVEFPAPRAGFTRSQVQPAIQAIVYGQAAPSLSTPTIPGYPVAPIPLMQRNTPKPPFNPYSG